MLKMDTESATIGPVEIKLKELFIEWMGEPSTQVAIRGFVERKTFHKTQIVCEEDEKEKIARPNYKTKKVLDVEPTNPKARKPNIKLPIQEFMDEIPNFFRKSASEKTISRNLQRAQVEAKQVFFDRSGSERSLDVREFQNVTIKIFQLSPFMNSSLFVRIDKKRNGKVDRKQTMIYFEKEFLHSTQQRQYFNLFRGCGHLSSKNEKLRKLELDRGPASSFALDSLVPSDFRLLMMDLLDRHPGLDFLKKTPTFQEKYAETVIVRIFYGLNVHGGENRITFRQFSPSPFLDSLLSLSPRCRSGLDINHELEYFSYEHFYVLYCHFWELDGDHDFKLDQNDLIKYSNYGLTTRIIERVISGWGRPSALSQKHQMLLKLQKAESSEEQAQEQVETPSGNDSYLFQEDYVVFGNGQVGRPSFQFSFEDFIWFCLSEEDKSSKTALAYWFRCIDIDQTGYLSPFELRYFLDECIGKVRVRAHGDFSLKFENVFQQLVGLVKPRDKNKITLGDLGRNRVVGSAFFDVLFNCNKFLMFEHRGMSIYRMPDSKPPGKKKKGKLGGSKHVEMVEEEDEGKERKRPRSPWSQYARISYDLMAQDDNNNNGNNGEHRMVMMEEEEEDEEDEEVERFGHYGYEEEEEENVMVIGNVDNCVGAQIMDQQAHYEQFMREYEESPDKNNNNNRREDEGMVVGANVVVGASVRGGKRKKKKRRKKRKIRKKRRIGVKKEIGGV